MVNLLYYLHGTKYFNELEIYNKYSGEIKVLSDKANILDYQGQLDQGKYFNEHIL